MNRILIPLLACACYAQTSPPTITVTYTLQPSFRRVELWEASGCLPHAMSIVRVKAAAVSKGLQPWGRSDAITALAQRTLFGVGYEVATDGGIAASGLLGIGAVTAKASIKNGVTLGAAIAVIVGNLVKGKVPVVDSMADKDLSPDTSGCGTTRFYAAPSVLKSFSVEVTP